MSIEVANKEANANRASHVNLELNRHTPDNTSAWSRTALSLIHISEPTRPY